MALEEAKKRKACQSCTKAKAKCSPFEDRLDICYRCQRLKKECVFDDTVRRRGPKNRSRVKQLEQRVDTLIDLLANGQGPKANLTEASNTDLSASVTSTEASLATPPRSESAVDLERRPQNVGSDYYTPVQTPETPRLLEESSSIPYDPVDARLLDDCAADSLLREYRDSYAAAFPFVIIPPCVNSKSLRRSQPFLFHAILTTTSHRTPGLQFTLAAKLKEQISNRIINHAGKSLELLQGMLIFAAWYHFYYHPVKQQLANIVQLCVAMVQDLGLSKNSRDQKKQLTVGEVGGKLYSSRSLAEKRAFLGAFYLTASFAQAWRRRATLSHTRYMDQCCQHLADCQEYTSDLLIKPLVQFSALMCRINDYFSYDDIDNSEVQGETLVQLSVTNFESELGRLTESIPQALIEHSPTLRLSIRLIEMWIYECAIHCSLWSTDGPSAHISSARLKTLYRCLNAVQSCVNTIIAIPDASLYHLGFASWSAWCYSCIIACKLVFLQDEREQQIEITETFTEIIRLVSDKSLLGEPKPYSFPVETVQSTWSPISVAKDGGILSLFHRMYSKTKFTIPEDPSLMPEHCDIDPLSRMAYLQRSLLCNIINRLKEHVAKLGGAEKSDDSANEPNAVVLRENWAAPQMDHTREKDKRPHMALLQNINFNSINFDSIAPMEDCLPPDMPFAEWLWNTTMDDFSIPHL